MDAFTRHNSHRVARHTSPRQSALLTHKVQIISIATWIFLTFMSIGFMFYAIHYQDNSDDILHKLDKRMHAAQHTLDDYAFYTKSAEDIIKNSNNIPKNRLLISGFDDAKLNILLEKFADNFTVKPKITKEQGECNSQFPDSNFQQAQCYKINLLVEQYSSDDLNIQFYKYLQDALPGFVIPVKILATRSENDGGASYALESQYYFVYFAEK